MPEPLTDLEQVVLFTLARLEDGAYGIAIRDDLAARAGRGVTLGAVYKVLWKLDRKGLVSTRDSEPTARRGGRRKRLYRPSAAGQRAMQEAVERLRRLTAGLAGLVP